MAPIKNIVTSALMLTAAVAAPVQLDRKSHAIADAPTGTHLKHHGEPMHKASPAMSRLPSGTFDTKAMQSSALAAAANLPTSGSQDDGAFSVLDNPPLSKERRQLDVLTRFLTKVNKAVKRGEGEGFDDIGGIGHFLNGLAGRAENGGIGDLTGLSGALNGLAKRELEDLARRGGDGGLGDIVGIIGGLTNRELEDLTRRGGGDGGLGDIVGIIGGLANSEIENLARRGGGDGGLAKRGKSDSGLGELDGILGSIFGSLGGLAKRGESDSGLRGLDGIIGGNEKEENADNKHYAKHGDAMLKDMNGIFHKAGNGKDKESQGTPKVQEPYGLGQLAKRQDLGDASSLIDDLDLGLARSLTERLAKREDMADEHVKRQLGAAGAIASGALNNAGTAANHLGKLASRKVRRTSLQGGQADPVVAPILPLEASKHKDTSNDDDMTGSEEIAKEVASGEKTADEATKTMGFSANRGIAKGPLGKRQVPPIAGADLPTVVKGIAANPSIALAPLTHGVKVAGTDL